MAQKLKTFNDIGSLHNQRVLLRIDLNVPVVENVTDYTRIERILPTIKALSAMGAKIILLSHFGRPKGQYNEAFSLKLFVPILSKKLQMPVQFSPNCIGVDSQKLVQSMLPGDVLLLENTRFHDGEEKNDAEFVKELAKNGDIFVNDSFSTAHRMHASTTGLADVMPSFAGLSMQEELAMLDKVIGNPSHPILAIVGGSKVSTKIDLLTNLVTKVDGLILGGGMANTFLAAHGVNIGTSLCEYDLFDVVHKTMAKALEFGCDILLPEDALVAQECRVYRENTIFPVPIDNIPSDKMILDMGPKTIDNFSRYAAGVATVLWNGPLGVFEIPPFDKATVSFAQLIAKKTRNGELISVAGGGDTVSALSHAGVREDFTYVSTAGGAFLEWLEGKTLPGVSVLFKE